MKMLLRHLNFPTHGDILALTLAEGVRFSFDEEHLVVFASPVGSIVRAYTQENRQGREDTKTVLLY